MATIREVKLVCYRMYCLSVFLPLSHKTKTKDNVFVNMTVSVQYRILPSKVYEVHICTKYRENYVG